MKDHSNAQNFNMLSNKANDHIGSSYLSIILMIYFQHNMNFGKNDVNTGVDDLNLVEFLKHLSQLKYQDHKLSS